MDANSQEAHFDDHHNLKWYANEAERLSSIVRVKFGADLDSADRKDIRDAIYRAVNEAIYRHGRVKP